ncbi:MAG: hypothetical protein GX780_06730 [Campylobacteraceae bacterium]|nr:hypothetical protein [Campylobacteraceae bacterium]
MHTLEPTPTPERFVCKALTFMIASALVLAPWIIAFWSGWVYHWSIGVGIGIFGYLIVGILSSKMRQLSIPKDQREISFTSYEISRWFVARYILCDS